MQNKHILERYLKGENLKCYNFLSTVESDGERGYKYKAHLHWVNELKKRGQSFRELIMSDLNDARWLVKSTVSKVNLIHSSEKSAYKTALNNDDVAEGYLLALAKLLEAGWDKTALKHYLETPQDLNDGQFERDKTKPTTWPIASIIPFLARPDTFPFVKPKKVNETFTYLGLTEFKKRYQSRPNLDTYLAVKELYLLLGQFLKEISNKQKISNDYIDAQTVIFMISGGYDGVNLGETIKMMENT